MRILITGAAGQVGRELQTLGLKKGHDIMAVTREQLDVSNEEDVNNLIEKLPPGIVINAAAYTAVDRAEEETEEAFRTNRSGPENLACACAKQNIPLIHFSTDYVFDGAGAEPYRETDAISPLNVYGHSKAEGEQAVRENLKQHIILRTSWVFSSHGSNFVKTILRLSAERDQLNIVADQQGGPTDAHSIASAALDIAEKVSTSRSSAKHWGTYHYSGSPNANWYEFAREIVEHSAPYRKKTPALSPIQTKDYPTPAARPRYSILDCSKIQETFGITQPLWRDSLRKVQDTLLNREAQS